MERLAMPRTAIFIMLIRRCSMPHFSNPAKLPGSRLCKVVSPALRRLRFLIECLVLFLAAGAAAAQDYPNRVIRLVVPFAAGGAPDVIARNIASRLEERLGQKVLVDNRLGASGNIAYENVARSAPDGYTLVLASPGIATNVSLFKNLPFDPLKDFAPITLVARSPHVLVVHPSVPANSVRELIVLAKSKPGQLSYGSAGAGTTLHLAGEMFSTATGTQFLHVPYRGNTLALADLMSGSIQLMFSDIPSALPQIKAGRLRALAVTGAQRSSSMPDVPTIAEAGAPGYAIEAWYGILTSAGTPAPIVDRLNRELKVILDDPAFKRKMQDLALEMSWQSPQEFGGFLGAQIKRLGEVVKASGARLD
jgi:tripartite-type tricarboxylate transporter receptor subunit TctC